jgi:hypothetical protein
MVIWSGQPGTSPACITQSPEAPPPEFGTELEELQWLLTRAYPLKDVTPTMQRENIFVLPEHAIWPGPYTDDRPDSVHQRTSQNIWDARKDQILQQQRDMNAKLAEERSARAKEKKRNINKENRKRRAASFMGPTAKKARLESGAQAQAQAEHEQRWADYEEAEDRRAEQQARLQEDARIAVKISAELSAQEQRISALPAEQREQEKEKIKIRVRREHAAQKRQEKALRERRIKEFNKERLEKGLQLLSEPAPLSEEEAQRLADEARDRARNKEARRQAELEAIQQEAVKARKEVERKKKETAAALDKTGEGPEPNPTAYSKAITDAKAAEIERRRQQHITDQKVAAEQRRRKEEEEEARQEAARRAYLFKDKWGVAPAIGLRLDAHGRPEPGQGFARPKNTRRQDLSRSSEAEQIALATQRSMDDLSKAKENARKCLEAKAESEGMSIEEFAKVRGFLGSEEYLRDVLTPKLPEGYPQITGDEREPSNVLEMSRYWIKLEAREGLTIRAKLENRSRDDIAREKGYPNTEEYLQKLSESITMNYIPPLEVKDPTGRVINAEEIYLKWATLNDRIRAVGEWEYRIRALPEPGTAEKRVGEEQKIFAEL